MLVKRLPPLPLIDLVMTLSEFVKSNGFDFFSLVTDPTTICTGSIPEVVDSPPYNNQRFLLLIEHDSHSVSSYCSKRCLGYKL